MVSDVLIVSSVVVVEHVDRPSIQQVAWQAPKCRKRCLFRPGRLLGQGRKVFVQARKVPIQAKKGIYSGQRKRRSKGPSIVMQVHCFLTLTYAVHMDPLWFLSGALLWGLLGCECLVVEAVRVLSALLWRLLGFECLVVEAVGVFGQAGTEHAQELARHNNSMSQQLALPAR